MASQVQAHIGARRSFVSVVRRYEHLFILLGAIIVFATYIIKDLLRDELRDLVESIEVARSSFTVRSDVGFASQLVISVQDQVADILTQVNSRDSETNGDFYSNQINGDLENAREQVLAYSHSLDNTADLLRKLPNQENRLKRVDQLRAALDNLGTHRFQFQSEINANPNIARSSKTAEKIRTLRNEISDLYCPACQVSTEAIEEAEHFKAQKEISYIHWRKASWWLYGFGWGIGLLSALCKIKKFTISEVAEATA